MNIKFILFAVIMIFISLGTLKSQVVQKEIITQDEDLSLLDDKNPINYLPDLTEEQKQKIETLHFQLSKDQLSYQNQIEEKEAHLKTISTVDKADITAINKTIDEIYNIKAALAKKEAASNQEIRNILTDKQRVIFDTQPKVKFKRYKYNIRKGSEDFDKDLNRGTPKYKIGKD